MVDFIFDLQRFDTYTDWTEFVKAVETDKEISVEYAPTGDTTASSGVTILATQTVTIATTGTLNMGTFSIESAGALKISSSTITGTSTILKITGGTATVDGTATLTGDIEVNDGTFTVENTLDLTGNITEVSGGLVFNAATTVTGDINLNSTNATLTITAGTLTVNGSYTSTSTTLQGDSGKLVVNLGNGNTYSLNSSSKTQSQTHPPVKSLSHTTEPIPLYPSL